MRNIIKYFTEVTYKPLLVKYLSKTRHYSYAGIDLIIPAEVFHPGFFFSTKLLLQQLNNALLQNKTFLELGAGSGLISFYAAKKGAIVTATDINPAAIEYLERNSHANKTQLRIIHSDLFEKIPIKEYEYILINPPYYKKQPQNFKDYAWCCGEHGEYFQKLFQGIAAFMHTSSKVFMVLCDGCDMQMINDFASNEGFKLECIFTKRNLLEKNFIYKIERIDI